MIIPELDELFFEQMSNYLNFAPVARIVNSYEEARRVHSLHADAINNRFNRFSLAYYTVANRHTHFNFSLYVDIKHQKIYVFFDEIETERMVIADRLPPECSGEFSISAFYDEMLRFLSTDFTDAVKNYYEGTPYGFENITHEDQGMYSLCKFGDVSGFAYFKAQTGFHKLNLAFFPDLTISREYTKPLPDVYADYGMLTCNTVSLKIAYDCTGEYVYMTNGIYLWSVRVRDFNRFIEAYYDSVKEASGLEGYRLILLEE